ncbi:hypothetical protein GGX14DRAFT_402433 [Mycena pura]|uniref:Secreted protein n=1 Tax=Mycena pura TaxID=153505 RepID=A0AAD6Y3S9_9AGAR|nr:hypothetical protein GGX14DRAFT_402433 [Mycena pura]
MAPRLKTGAVASLSFVCILPSTCPADAKLAGHTLLEIASMTTDGTYVSPCPRAAKKINIGPVMNSGTGNRTPEPPRTHDFELGGMRGDNATPAPFQRYYNSSEGQVLRGRLQGIHMMCLGCINYPGNQSILYTEVNPCVT